MSEAKHEPRMAPLPPPSAGSYVAMIFVVVHAEFKEQEPERLRAFGKADSLIYDSKFSCRQMWRICTPRYANENPDRLAAKTFFFSLLLPEGSRFQS